MSWLEFKGHYKFRATDQSGFTIIELMISTLVFSVVLLLITIGVIQFNESYYKGVVQSNTQNVSRTVVENIGQAIQFNGGQLDSNLSASGNSKGVCVGDVRYSYLIGYQLVNGVAGTDQTNHALVSDSPGTCNGSSAQNLQTSAPLTTSSTELLGENMRLAKLSVTEVGSSSLYQIDVRVVYGADDLLCSPNEVAGSCTNIKAMPSGKDYQYPDLQCKPKISGSQFCAASELSSTVEKRIN